MPELSLAALQAWMQGRVTGGIWGQPSTARDGVASAELVVESATLSAEARLDIYARSYVLRLAECLRAEFPVLRALIGEQVFDLFAGSYLSARPPSSPSLYELGAGFADYLEATRPRPHSGPGTLEALPASLARLERAISEATRALGPEGATDAAPLDVAALLGQPSLRLRTPQTLKLLRLDFDFTEMFETERAGRRPTPPPACETLVAVARSHYRVRVHKVEPMVFAWLEALRDCDGAVSEAVRRAASACHREQGAVIASLIAWAPAAIGLGFLLPATKG